VYLKDFQGRFEPRLLEVLSRRSHRLTEGLDRAMAYTPLAGGKRLRPALIELWSRAGSPPKGMAVLDTGVAVELIHACSLVLDDLPSMDDAGLRRGQPTCHREFGVDTAILAANAQLMLAFEVLGELDAWSPRLEATSLVARAVGSGGMVAGQFADLQLTEDERDLEVLEFIHRHKTGILFEACASLGVRLGGGEDSLEEVARVYARNLGLAFQIKDDLLDATGHAEEMGKDARQDRGKATFTSCLGATESEEIMHRLLDTAREAARDVPRSATLLDAVCTFVGSRNS
jgi:geranylgeranyl pyrophosphate synthase